MSIVWNCIVGPKLFRIYAVSSKVLEQNDFKGSIYSENLSERFGNNVVRAINIAWNIGLYMSPFIISYLYQRDYFSATGCIQLGKVSAGIVAILLYGVVFRGLGRVFNPTYCSFLSSFKEVQTGMISKSDFLTKYDFEFTAWSPDFSWDEVEGEKDKNFVQTVPTGAKSSGVVGSLFTLPSDVIAFLCVRLFGRQLMYPGSTQLIQALMDPMLMTGRQKLITEQGGRRHKLVTRDGNDIDTMFVDRRENRKTRNNTCGSILVVCCEGNAGFYEVGTMTTPLEAGYSVLGWNHPGFSGSTGQPFPVQDQYAMDVVMQFAIHKLGFSVEDIVIFAWSIGGYPGTWGAMNYPEIRGLVLDATFDHVLPLAEIHMPTWMRGVVRKAIYKYLNLNNAEQLSLYPGPVTIVRRTKDEIITTSEGLLSANRGNDLLVSLLSRRYPKLMDVPIAIESLRKWLAEDKDLQSRMYRSLDIDAEFSEAQLVSHFDHSGRSFPSSLGESWSDDEKTRMVIFLAEKHLVNFAAGHNVPLESRYFKLPWAPLIDSSFVQV